MINKTEKNALISKEKQEKTYYNEFMILAKILIEVLKSFENKTVNKRLITKVNDLLAKENHIMRLSFSDIYSNINLDHGWRAIRVTRYVNNSFDYDFNKKDFTFRAYTQNGKLILDEAIQNINDFLTRRENDLIALNDAIQNYDSYIQMINELNEHVKTFNQKRNRFICEHIYI